MSIRNKLYLHSETQQKVVKIPTTILNSLSDDKTKENQQVPLKKRPASPPLHPLASTSSLSQNITPVPSPTPSKKLKRERVLVDAEKVVSACKSKYRPFFTPTIEASDDSPRASPLQEDHVLTLEYPCSGESEKFLLWKPVKMNQRQDALEDDHDEYHPVNDLYQSAFFIYDCYLTTDQQKRLGDASHGVMRNLTKYRNRRNGQAFAQAVNEFNAVVLDFKSDRQLKKLRHPTYDLACHILYQVYSRTVAHQADALNNYQAFSNYVYGEINAILVKEFIERTNITAKSVFMDLGCGIGNVVLQVAAQTACEAYGIEIMDLPCKFAKRQLREYATRMRAWCLPTGKVHFRHGDFLDTTANDMHSTMIRADVLLVNNYAFDAKTNHALAHMFLDLKEGAKIISLKSFVPKHHKINQRTVTMPESILQVKEYEYFSEAVSWTNNSGVYYISTVNRERLKPYYDALVQ
ncbi:histone methylation protein DOT1-domain-containing protein [Gongronella butleri]|nr:histone methylation protein DOT1-domain-containing protein [Gongronella butleri]